MTTECQRTAPERIYLNIFSENDEPFPNDHEGITWCDSEVGDADPAYIRSDIADAEIARLQAQVDALSGVVRMYLDWVNSGLIKDPGMVAIEHAAIAALAAVGR